VTNTLFLAVFTVLAGVLGTTGAAMLGIRPLLEMNQGRHYTVHTIVFFILLVCNVGGILSAVGDPPLFIGFLKGIPFFWPTQNLGGSFVWIGTYLLVLYALLETVLWKREGSPSPVTPSFPLLKWVTIRGKSHLILAGGLIGILILTAHVKMGDWKIDLWSVGKVGLPLGDMVRHGSVLLLMGLSLVLKPLSQRAKEHWHLHPLGEIALLFCAIFITAEPVIHLLQAEGGGQASGVFSALKSPSLDQALLYFWLTGLLSSFLDNAPTYLVFFSLAGGDPALLTGSLRIILVAISTGAVFMGALTYIGNAPNLLVKAIAEEEYGVAMPHFLAYIFWACLALIPPLAFWSVWTFGFPS
jgi:Na+/H+ antiporter NhaD/arsenite permease-like protein